MSKIQNCRLTHINTNVNSISNCNAFKKLRLYMNYFKSLIKSSNKYDES